MGKDTETEVEGYENEMKGQEKCGRRKEGRKEGRKVVGYVGRLGRQAGRELAGRELAGTVRFDLAIVAARNLLC